VISECAGPDASRTSAAWRKRNRKIPLPQEIRPIEMTQGEASMMVPTIWPFASPEWNSWAARGDGFDYRSMFALSVAPTVSTAVQKYQLCSSMLHVACFVLCGVSKTRWYPRASKARSRASCGFDEGQIALKSRFQSGCKLSEIIFCAIRSASR
jgi:hypothetical protein